MDSVIDLGRQYSRPGRRRLTDRATAGLFPTAERSPNSGDDERRIGWVTTDPAATMCAPTSATIAPKADPCPFADGDALHLPFPIADRARHVFRAGWGRRWG
jgi:hypothetical protein